MTRPKDLEDGDLTLTEAWDACARNIAANEAEQRGDPIPVAEPKSPHDKALCWATPDNHTLNLAPVRCDREKGHQGPHSWEPCPEPTP